MKKIITSIVICFTLVLSTFVFSANKRKSDFKQMINNQFFNQVVNSTQEKVYLQTDKPYYSAGEEIWFKSYLGLVKI